MNHNMKNIGLIALFLVMSVMSYANSEESKWESRLSQNSNWLRSSTGDDSELRGNLIGDDEGEGEGSDPTVPVGGGLPCLLLLSGGYAFYKKRKK
jgi:LPXTG-motif cell wall-anchored protein